MREPTEQEIDMLMQFTMLCRRRCESMKYATVREVVKPGIVDAVCRRFGVRKEAAKNWLEEFPERNIEEVMSLTPDQDEWSECLREITWGRRPIDEIRRICEDA